VSAAGPGCKVVGGGACGERVGEKGRERERESEGQRERDRGEGERRRETICER